VDNVTKALNLWDIENRIAEIHKELEALHQMKSEILDIAEPDQIICG